MRTPSILLSLTTAVALLGAIGFIYHRRAVLRETEMEPVQTESDRRLAKKFEAMEVQIPGAWDLERPKPGWSIWLKDSSATPADVKEVCQMSMLVAVLLEGPGVTDDWLESMKGHRYIASVRLFSTSVTDRGLAHLATLPALRFVLLTEGAVTARGISSLRVGASEVRG
jgi:hypothetical protein